MTLRINGKEVSDNAIIGNVDVTLTGVGDDGPRATIGGQDALWAYDPIAHDALADILVQLKEISLHLQAITDERIQVNGD